MNYEATKTHIVLDIFVGTGIQQQPRAVRVTIASGQNQRRVPKLRKCWANLPPPPNNTSAHRNTRASQCQHKCKENTSHGGITRVYEKLKALQKVSHTHAQSDIYEVNKIK
jgi:hypothetical protein